MRKTLSLNDDLWLVGSVKQKPFGAANDLAEVQEWLPARVPGDVRLDLMRAGKIADPFIGTNNEASQWVDARDWWYVREVTSDRHDGTRTFLVLDGVDYQSAVFWNGRELGRHVGMFSPQVYELPSGGSGQLAIRVWGSDALPRFQPSLFRRFARTIAPRLAPGHPAFPDRLRTLKCQMSFGWDFAPRLRTCGIWDNAWLVQTGSAFIRELWVQGVPDGRVTVHADVDALGAAQLRAQFQLAGLNAETVEQSFEFEIEASSGENHYEFQFQIDAPRVWNPWDRGEANLYELRLALVDDSGEIDAKTATFGLRTVDLAPNAGAPGEEPPWTFVINGVPEFIRGANWVPADAIPGRVTREDYAELIRMAREANINLLRVWGGGLREKQAFYDLCDENGILVWQEFPFSGAPLDHLHRDRAFLAFTRAECGAIVRSLRNHPSIVLWCGGNEYNTMVNAPLVTTLLQTVATFDGTRPFKPGSPSVGEHHNWRVWHGLANTRDYQDDDAGFFAEFGLQALPNLDTLKRFLPPDQLFPPGAGWLYHKAEIEKLWRYARPVKHKIESAADFVEASQEAQLRGLQVMIEHARRSKWRSSGCAVWQFNDPWPAISWSLLDYWRSPKRAYFKVKELYNPILVSFYYPLAPRASGDSVEGELWLINDTLEPVAGELRAYLNDRCILALAAGVGANAASAVGSLQAILEPGANALRLELVAGERVIATNEYDLNYCDRGEIGWVGSRLSDIADRFKS